MFTELKGTIALRRQIEEVATTVPASYMEAAKEYETARQIVQDFLIKNGHILTTISSFRGERVTGWIAAKKIYVPAEGDPDMSKASIYHIIITALFKKSVSDEEKIAALNSTGLEIILKGELDTETKIVLPPCEQALDITDKNVVRQTRITLAYAREVIDMIERDPFIGKTILVPNPKP